jgi:DNA (cytosine-5)-methyltransferase 1
MRSIELFAGIGGIALAAEWADIETVAFCEREPFCQKVLKKHWPKVPIFDDVKTLNRQLLEEKGVIEPGGTIDIISGGFPCQPYSLAGKRKGKEDDRDLWPEMFRIIKELRPTWVVGENVANFVNMELDRTLSNLESIGYKGQSFIIPACAVDAKHRRERTFIVAYSDSGGHIHGQVKEFPTETREHAQCKPVSSSSDVSNASSKRLPRGKETGNFKEKRKNSDKHPSGFHQEPRGQWAVEPDVGRVAYGVPNRVDRLKGLGNAVVPQQIYPIFKYIMEIERMKKQ